MNEVNLLKAHDPAAGALPLGARDALLTAVAAAPTPRRRRGLLTLTLAGAVATVGSGGLAYAVLSGQPPATALKVNCSVGTSKAEFDKTANFTTVLDVHTGDPVADCGSEYQRLGLPVPALRAYTSGSVFIWVVPQSWRVPGSWQPLAADFRSDPSRLVLKQRLDDPVDGPGAECRSTAAAHEAVEREISQLGLSGWSIEAAPGATEADGRTACAFAWVDEGAAKNVLVQAGVQAPHDGNSTPYQQLLARLRSDIASRCLSISDAKSAAERAVADTGIPATVTAAPVAGSRCTAVDVAPGGALTIRLS